MGTCCCEQTLLCMKTAKHHINDYFINFHSCTHYSFFRVAQHHQCSMTFYTSYTQYINNNDNNGILTKHEPLVYTRARRAVQRKKKKKRKKGQDSTTATTSSPMDSTPADTTHIHHSLSPFPPPPPPSLSHIHTHRHTHTHTHPHPTAQHTHTHAHTSKALLTCFTSSKLGLYSLKL